MMKDYSLLVYNLDVAGGVGKKGKDRSGPVSPSREVSSAIRVISSPLPETWYEPLSSHRSVDGHRETRTPGNIRKEVWDTLYRGGLTQN
jgi:hypothetical protein